MTGAACPRPSSRPEAACLLGWRQPGRMVGNIGQRHAASLQGAPAQVLASRTLGSDSPADGGGCDQLSPCHSHSHPTQPRNIPRTCRLSKGLQDRREVVTKKIFLVLPLPSFLSLPSALSLVSLVYFVALSISLVYICNPVKIVNWVKRAC